MMPSRNCPKCGTEKQYSLNCLVCGTWEDFWLKEENAKLQNENERLNEKLCEAIPKWTCDEDDCRNPPGHAVCRYCGRAKPKTVTQIDKLLKKSIRQKALEEAAKFIDQEVDSFDKNSKTYFVESDLHELFQMISRQIRNLKNKKNKNQK